jgi:hypothetical protein
MKLSEVKTFKDLCLSFFVLEFKAEDKPKPKPKPKQASKKS